MIGRMKEDTKILFQWHFKRPYVADLVAIIYGITKRQYGNSII